MKGKGEQTTPFEFFTASGNAQFSGGAGRKASSFVEAHGLASTHGLVLV